MDGAFSHETFILHQDLNDRQHVTFSIKPVDGGNSMYLCVFKFNYLKVGLKYLSSYL